MNREKIGVILLNLGGPDSLKAVKPFLYNLFSDKLIIRLGPSFTQKLFALIISSLRSKTVKKYYEAIGGKSPILDITNQQAKALEQLLNLDNDSNPIFKVYVGMRYWHPYIHETVNNIYNDGIKKLIALPLYPHYSITTSGSSLSVLKEAIKKYPIRLITVESWYDNPMYISALVELIKKGLERFSLSFNEQQSEKDKINVLFSAHSLPEKFIKEGDPYVEHIMGTIKKITEILDIKWHLSYQSKSGPVKWLEPSTEETIINLSREGVKNLLIVPISFVSDHIETLFEIDILYKDLAKSHGIKMVRTESLNTNPTFIRALKDITMNNIKKAGWIN
jgi:ferrochelatase